MAEKRNLIGPSVHSEGVEEVGDIFLFFVYYFVCVGRSACSHHCVQEQELVVSFYQMGSRDHTQVSGLVQQESLPIEPSPPYPLKTWGQAPRSLSHSVTLSNDRECPLKPWQGLPEGLPTEGDTPFLFL